MNTRKLRACQSQFQYEKLISLGGAGVGSGGKSE